MLSGRGRRNSKRGVGGRGKEKRDFLDESTCIIESKSGILVNTNPTIECDQLHVITHTY
jgi:hypothetical protein